MVEEGFIVKIISKNIYGVASYNSRNNPNVWTIWTEDGYVVATVDDMEVVDSLEDSDENLEEELEKVTEEE